MFLVNMRSYLVFALLSSLGFAICAIMACRFVYFRQQKEAYIFGGVIETIQASFTDTLLCAFVQLKNVQSLHTHKNDHTSFRFHIPDSTP